MHLVITEEMNSYDVIFERQLPWLPWPLVVESLSNLPQKGGLFKKQLGAYTKQFAGSLTPQAQQVKGLSALIYHAVAFTRQHN